MTTITTMTTMMMMATTHALVQAETGKGALLQSC
jgi:hypothetical protein